MDQAEEKLWLRRRSDDCKVSIRDQGLPVIYLMVLSEARSLMLRIVFGTLLSGLNVSVSLWGGGRPGSKAKMVDGVRDRGTTIGVLPVAAANSAEPTHKTKEGWQEQGRHSGRRWRPSCNTHRMIQRI